MTAEKPAVGALLPELRRMRPLDAVVRATRTAAVAAVPRSTAQPPHGALDAARRSPRRWDGRDVIAVIALIVGMLAPALVLPSPRTGRPALHVEDAMLWVGVCAAASVAGFALIERRRRDMYTLGAHTKAAPRVVGVLVVCWTLALAWCLGNGALRFAETPQVAGVVLLGAASAAGVALLFVAVRRDRAARADPAVAAKDAWGRTPGEVDPVVAWWTAFPDALAPEERDAAYRSYTDTLDLLAAEGVIRPGLARRLRRKGPRAVWAGDAS